MLSDEVQLTFIPESHVAQATVSLTTEMRARGCRVYWSGAVNFMTNELGRSGCIYSMGPHADSWRRPA